MPPFGVDHTKKLLPDVLPSGDPTRFALPIFLKEPSDTFLIKSKPATLHCRVAHALRVFFQCNSENVEPSQKEDHVEPESGVRYTEASVDIDREQVEEYFSEFHCACVAISGKGSVVSRHALVTNACKLRLCLRTPLDIGKLPRPFMFEKIVLSSGYDAILKPSTQIWSLICMQFYGHLNDFIILWCCCCSMNFTF